MKKIVNLIFISLLRSSLLFAQDAAETGYHISSIPADGILLNTDWKFQAGDNLQWANPAYDAGRWQAINPVLEIADLPQIRKETMGWFRITLLIDSSLRNKPLAFQVYQSVASEIYLDGQLLQRYGVLNSDNAHTEAIQPLNDPFGVVFTSAVHVLAVRFAIQKNLPYLKYTRPYTAFGLRINEVYRAGKFKDSGNGFPLFNAIYLGIFIVLSIIHLGLFLIYKKQKANLFFSMATLSGAFGQGLYIRVIKSHQVAERAYLILPGWICLIALFNLFLFIAIHQLFLHKKDFYFKALIVYCLASILCWFYFYHGGETFAFYLPFLFSMLASLRISIMALRNKFRFSGIIILGVALYLVSFTLYWIIYQRFVPDKIIGLGNYTLVDLAYQVSALSVPITLSFYLSRDFAFTSKELEIRLSEVQQLSKEKQQILISQNEMLESKVTLRTSELKQSLIELKSTQAQLIQTEKMASLGELTAGVAHEIQNPLNFVNNFSDVNTELLDEATQEIEKGNMNEVKEILKDIKGNEQKINQHGKRADSIVKSMLQHATPSGGTRESSDINVLVDEWLQRSFQGFRSKDKNFNVTVKTDFDVSIGKISIIPQDVSKVLLNVYNNAFYATNEKLNAESKMLHTDYKPTVSVQTKKINDKVEIIVSDNGNGIPQKIIDKIFQPFFTTKPTGQGTGLGLSLAYDIVKAHGGEIKVASKNGEGSEFIIQLPLEK